MALLVLDRLISMRRRRRRRRRQIQHCNGLVISVPKRKDSPCQEDDNSQGGKRLRYSGLVLSEDIWHHIHSLLPLRDAARAACVSRTFLHSWRCYPNLILNEDTLSLKECAPGRDFIRKVDHILNNHSGIGLKALRIKLVDFYDVNIRSGHLNNWLQTSIVPGIKEITLMLTKSKAKYNFPCSLFSGGIGNSIQHLQLCFCTFHPTVDLGSFRNLIRLHLYSVHIMQGELECLLSNSFALMQLELRNCPKIIRLEINCQLQQLTRLVILGCRRLQVVESKAPNLSVFHFSGEVQVKISLVEQLSLQKINMCRANLVFYARSELPSSVPNLESLTISSGCEVVNTPMLPSKFLFLKYLTVQLIFSQAYDYFSLVSFLDASPSLETFNLHVSQHCMEHKSIFEDSDLRQMTEHHHDNLKSVNITNFSSAKCLVELVCHIVENTVSLECLTLDTTTGQCSTRKSNRCFPMSKGILMESPKALSAIRTYIEKKVPSTVKLSVLEPCSRCHAVQLEHWV